MTFPNFEPIRIEIIELMVYNIGLVGFCTLSFYRKLRAVNFGGSKTAANETALKEVRDDEVEITALLSYRCGSGVRV